MSLQTRKYIPAWTLLSAAIIFSALFWLPRPAVSISVSDICPKHNFSTGEYTSCYYCHNAETQEEAGFSINSESNFCLSCHDGTADLSSYATLGSISERISGTMPIGHIKGVDHPFSVGYTEARNLSPTLKLKIFPESPVKIFNGKVECASCHDPHSCANPVFLRIPNDRSNLCLACHEM